jgi:hypothetical protein
MAKAGVVFVGTQAGLEVWSDPGGSGRWRRRITALGGTPITAIAAADALSVAVSLRGGGLISHDGGLSWQDGPPPAAAASAATELVLAGLPPAVLRGTHTAIERRSEDDGAWQPVLAGAVTVLHAVSYHQDSVWAGAADGGLWLSSDRGRSWQQIGNADAAISALCAVRLI